MGLLQKIKDKQIGKRRKAELLRRNPQLMRGQDDYNFRRSRTLTGTTSSQVKATSEQQAQLKSPRLKAQELRRHRRKLLFVLMSSILGMVLAGWLLTQFTARVKADIIAVTNSTSVNDTYAEAIQSYFREQPLERLQFALNEKALTGYVQQVHPEVKEITLESDATIGEGTFDIELRQPVVGWNVGGREYFVDAEGVSFAENYYDSPEVIVQDDSGISPDAQQGVVASNRFLSFLGRIVGLTGQSGLGRVEKVTIPAGIGSRSIELQLSERTYPIRMHIDRDPAAQVEDMKRAVQFFEQHGRTPQYLDVRVASKVFYRED